MAENIPHGEADTSATQGAAAAAFPVPLREALRRGPFHRALREAIAYRRLSLAELQAQLDLLGAHAGQSTLSYWQRGQRRPEMPRAVPTVHALEVVLRLPDGSLLALVEPESRPAPDPATTSSLGLSQALPTAAAPAGEDTSVPVTDVLADVFADALTGGQAHAAGASEATALCADLDVLFVHETVICGADRVQRGVTTRIVVRAARQGADRYVGVYHGDESARIEAALIRVAEGCRPGRISRHAAGRSLAVELLFDRRLAEGETHVFCYSVLDDSGGPSPGFHRRFRQPAGDYLLQLAFHRKALPVRCTRQFTPHDDAEGEQTADLVYGLGGVASAYFPQVDPGRAGIIVEWT